VRVAGGALFTGDGSRGHGRLERPCGRKHQRITRVVVGVRIGILLILLRIVRHRITELLREHTVNHRLTKVNASGIVIRSN
jgi:hypothetical protein